MTNKIIDSEVKNPETENKLPEYDSKESILGFFEDNKKKSSINDNLSIFLNFLSTLNDEQLEKVSGLIEGVPESLFVANKQFSDTQERMLRNLTPVEGKRIDTFLGNHATLDDYIIIADWISENIERGNKAEVLAWFNRTEKKHKKGELLNLALSGFTPEIISSLNSVLPEKHIKPNNKLANEIVKDFADSGPIALRVSRTGANKKITTKALLTYESENISISGKVPFTPYDREVHDGVVTLYEAGNNVITPSMVYRAMNGMTETEYVSPQAVELITKSLDKSLRMRLSIDFTEEAKLYKRDTTKATYEGYLLACDKITVASGGDIQEAYKLLRKPILYEYAQVSGQVINVPIMLLQTKGAVRSTEDVTVIRGHLLRQIEFMKSESSKRNNHIAYESIYESLEVTEDKYNSADGYNQKTKVIRQHIDRILKEWVNQKYIKGYEQYKQGKRFKGVKIHL